MVEFKIMKSGLLCSSLHWPLLPMMSSDLASDKISERDKNFLTQRESFAGAHA